MMTIVGVVVPREGALVSDEKKELVKVKFNSSAVVFNSLQWT